MKNNTINSLTKSFKSMKVVKMLNDGLIKFAKLINLNPNLLYIILGLITVILVALGLGARREGFDSVSNVNNALRQIVDNVNGAINNMEWNSDSDKSNFISNVNFLYMQQMIYYIDQGGTDLKTYDLNNNQQIYKLNPAFQGTKDVSGNALPMYVEDSMNTAQTPQFLQQYTIINVAKSITKADLDVLRTQLDNRINNFSSINPSGQVRLQNACEKLNAYAGELIKFLMSNPNAVGTPSYINILSQGTMVPTPFSAKPLPNTNVANTIVANSGNTSASMNQHVKYDVNNTNVTYASVNNPITNSPWGAYNIPNGSQSNVPPGKEDMYMLKTQATPPSNPAGSPYGSNSGSGSNFGSGSNSGSNTGFNTGSNNGAGADSNTAANPNPSPSPTVKTCGCPAPVPPCPPCERCPEPAFDCKKVPNYNSASVNQYLPQPILADFSQFGM